MGAKFLFPEITLNAESFCGVPFDDQYRRCPDRIEAMEISWPLFYMSFERYKVLVDEGREFRVGI